MRSSAVVEGVLAVANGRKHLEGLERLVRLEDIYKRTLVSEIWKSLKDSVG